MIHVRNVTRGTIVGERVLVADTSGTRRTGLLKHSSLPPGEGLWIVPCEGIHTFGMKFAIDVAYLDKKRKILKVRPAMRPRRISACLWAHSVIELPAGTLEATSTQAGDVFEFSKI